MRCYAPLHNESITVIDEGHLVLLQATVHNKSYHRNVYAWYTSLCVIDNYSYMQVTKIREKSI